MNTLTRDFLNSCKLNNLQDVIKNVKNDYNFLYRMIYQSMNTEYYKEGFNFACKLGYYDIAQWLYYNSYILNITYNKNDLFKIFADTCIIGDERLCKWIYNLITEKEVKIPDDILNNAFINACNYNNYDLAKWLFDLNTSINSTILDNAFNIKTYNNIYSEILDYELISANYNLMSYELRSKLYDTAIKINLELVKWLYELRKKNTDFKEINLKLFFEIIKTDNFDICEFLYNNDKYYDVDIYKNTIINLTNNCSHGESLIMLDNLSNINFYFGNCKEYIIKNFAMDFVNIKGFYDLIPYYKFCYLLLDKGINFEIDKELLNENNTLLKYKIARNIIKERGLSRIKIFDQLFPCLTKS